MKVILNLSGRISGLENMCMWARGVVLGWGGMRLLDTMLLAVPR
jgi:hypothetical protein